MKKSNEKVTVEVNASVEKVWKIIGAVDGVDKWFAPVIQSCRVEGNKRICGTEAGELIENIEKVDHASRIFQYAIPEQNMIPVKNIFGTMKVYDLGKGKSSVEWSALLMWKKTKRHKPKRCSGGLGPWELMELKS